MFICSFFFSCCTIFMDLGFKVIRSYVCFASYECSTFLRDGDNVYVFWPFLGFITNNWSNYSCNRCNNSSDSKIRKKPHSIQQILLKEMIIQYAILLKAILLLDSLEFKKFVNNLTKEMHP